MDVYIPLLGFVWWFGPGGTLVVTALAAIYAMRPEATSALRTGPTR